jgi:hypothetical protein
MNYNQNQIGHTMNISIKTTLADLDKSGKTNSKQFLQLCEHYHERSLKLSSNSGAIKSAQDITSSLKISFSDHDRNDIAKILIDVIADNQ